MSLIKHSAINLAGNFIPALLTLPAYGYLGRVLGVESFGIYTLAILIVGYAGIFDAGLTRATIREIAIFRNNHLERRKVIACGTVTIIVFGIISALTVKLLNPIIVDILNVSVGEKHEAGKSISLLALTIPVFLLNQIWLSILEGDERFVSLNIQRSIGAFFTAGIPVVMVYLNSTLYSAIYGLFIARIVTLFITALIVKDEVIRAGLRFDSVVFKRMIRFGGWSALTGIISPIMVYFDRIILSGMIGAKYVAYYSAPSDLISRALIIPSALARSIFPKLSLAKTESDRQALIFLGYKLIFLVCGIGALLVFLLSNFVMTTWMGESFSGEPVIVLKVLLVGFFFNAVAQIPFSDIQARGHSKITATLHMIEIVPYILLLMLLIKTHGVTGAAIAWSLRVTIDCFMLIIISKRMQSKEVNRENSIFLE